MKPNFNDEVDFKRSWLFYFGRKFSPVITDFHVWSSNVFLAFLATPHHFLLAILFSGIQVALVDSAI